MLYTPTNLKGETLARCNCQLAPSFGTKWNYRPDEQEGRATSIYVGKYVHNGKYKLATEKMLLDS